VPRPHLHLFLADLAAAYGSVHEYAVGHLGVDQALIERLREQLLTG